MNFNLNAAKALLGAAVVASAVTAVSQPASAITVNTGGTPSPNNGQVSNLTGDPALTTINFNGSTTLPSGVTVGATGGKIVSGSVANKYASPPGDTSNYLTVGSSPTPATESATFDLGGPKGYFGLFVGSLDTYNSIQFLLGDVPKTILNGVLKGVLTSVSKAEGVFTGTDVQTVTGITANGDQAVGVYYNFFADNNSDLFDKVVLRSTQAAFEVDNIAFRQAIPTPALLPGLIGMGVAAFRKRKSEEAGVEATETAKA